MEKNKPIGLEDDMIRAVVTLGPTDESIDDVMKITNMSTGFLGTIIAQTLLSRDTQKRVLLWLVCNKTTYLINKVKIDALLEQGAQLVLIGGVKNGKRVTSETQDMADELRALFSQQKIDYLFHSAAVGDYTGTFATNASLLAKEIVAAIGQWQAAGESVSSEKIAEILQNPQNLFNQDAKMSSDEPGMIVRLGLTPKIISHINSFAEAGGYTTKMVSWKLLSGVSEEELYNVALAHGRRNKSFLVVANDLDRISASEHWAMLINVATGARTYAHTKEEIANAICEATGL